MKNSPFQLAHTDNYNLDNTTHELLKFQLSEDARNNSLLENTTQTQHFDNSSFLQNALFDTSTKDVTQTRSDDSFDDGHISRVSTPDSDVSIPWNIGAEQDPRAYLNLKVLIENSVFDTSRLSQKEVLPLHKVKKLKQKIADKQEHKNYLTDRISISSQFCSTLLSNYSYSDNELDAKLLLKILKQTVSLQLELINTSEELDLLTHKLNSHNMACLVLGYVEDLKLSALPTGRHLSVPQANGNTSLDSNLLQALEVLFSHVASLAAQKDIPLPDFPSNSEQDSLQSKILWATQCIEALASQSRPLTGETIDSDQYDPNIDNSVVRDHSFLSVTPYDVYKKEGSENKTLSEYRLALNDLRFSHQYFMKEYEYLKQNSVKTILEYRRKNALLETEVSRLKNGSSMSLSSNLSSRDILESKDKEIAQLRREVNAYKIEFLGNKSPHESMHSALLTPESNEGESMSPSFKPMGLSMSNAILRKEFKKIVADMQDQYEIELSEERLKRRELEEKVQRLEIG